MGHGAADESVIPPEAEAIGLSLQRPIGLSSSSPARVLSPPKVGFVD
jgi:hypothetical protein